MLTNTLASSAEAVQSVTPLRTVFPAKNSLAAQLQQIAQIIQVRAALGVTRQIFFAGLGNFDTHSSQLSLQASLLSQVNGAMAAFYEATQELDASRSDHHLHHVGLQSGDAA